MLKIGSSGWHVALEPAVQNLIALFIMLGMLVLGNPSSARDIYLQKSTTDEIKSVCEKVGGKYSDDASGFGCGTNCNGGPGTDCVVYCKVDQKCIAQVIGSRRPTSFQSALQAPTKHAR